MILKRSESLIYFVNKERKIKKERFALLSLFRSFGKERIALRRSFLKERKSDSLFVALFKRVKERFALSRFF